MEEDEKSNPNDHHFKQGGRNLLAWLIIAADDDDADSVGDRGVSVMYSSNNNLNLNNKIEREWIRKSESERGSW